MKIFIIFVFFVSILGCTGKENIQVDAGENRQHSVESFTELPNEIQRSIDERNAAYTQNDYGSYERVQSKGGFTLKVVLSVQAGFTIVSEDGSYSESFDNIKEKTVNLTTLGMYTITFHEKKGYIPIKPMKFQAFAAKMGGIEGRYRKIK